MIDIEFKEGDRAFVRNSQGKYLAVIITEVKNTETGTTIKVDGYGKVFGSLTRHEPEAVPARWFVAMLGDQTIAQLLPAIPEIVRRVKAQRYNEIVAELTKLGDIYIPKSVPPQLSFTRDIFTVPQRRLIAELVELMKPEEDEPAPLETSVIMVDA